MIAYLINELDIRGGTHKQFLKLLDYTERRGEPFFIVTKRVDFTKTYPDFKRYEDRIRIFDCKRVKTLRLRSQMRALRRLVADADCVNIHDNGFERLLGAFRGKKVVWQVNDLPFCFRVGAAAGRKHTFNERLRKSRIVRNSGLITEFTVNVSKNRERILKEFGRDARVFYCGIDPVHADRSIESSFARFRSGRINILTSGVFLPYRNYETQISVIGRLRSEGIDARLKIIGALLDDDYAGKIRQLISEQGLDEYITVCGMVDEAEFRRLHSEADIFVFVNIDQSWGLSVFEAMSCGLPVIVSNSVGATEILADGENAIFADPTDSAAIAATVKRLMSDEDEYRRISENAGRFHTRYTWDDAYCSGMFDLINKLRRSGDETTTD